MKDTITMHKFVIVIKKEKNDKCTFNILMCYFLHVSGNLPILIIISAQQTKKLVSNSQSVSE